MDRESHTYPPLRALGRAVVVSEMRHLTRAADALGRSQSAITRSVTNLEDFIGLQLFERTATGMAETYEGKLLFRRARAAMDQMARAEAELRRKGYLVGSDRPRLQPFLRFDLKNEAIFVFLAVCDHRDIREAARSLGIAPSTARKSLRELERQIGAPLFEREPRGAVCPSKIGGILARHTKRALWEIRAGLDELKSRTGRIAGRIRIGVMSTARSFVVPRAVDQLRRLHPDVVVVVYWGNYDDLKVALSCGDIDFIVGTLRSEEALSTDHRTETLIEDRIEVVARTQHPFAGTGAVSLRELLPLDWILPPPYFPLRIWFRGVLSKHGLGEPKPFMETASLAILRGTLLESDGVALSTRLQCWHDTIEHGLLTVLPVKEFSAARVECPFHLHVTTRYDVVLSPAARAFRYSLTEVANELKAQIYVGEPPVRQPQYS